MQALSTALGGTAHGQALCDALRRLEAPAKAEELAGLVQACLDARAPPSARWVPGRPGGRGGDLGTRFRPDV